MGDRVAVVAAAVVAERWREQTRTDTLTSMKRRQASKDTGLSLDLSVPGHL